MKNDTSSLLDGQDSSNPMYAQVYEYIHTQIVNGVYKANQKIPSESELIEMLGVSRITIRQGLSKLQSEGLIFKVHGRGTFVSAPKVTQNLESSLQGFGIAMRKMGHESYSRLLSYQTVRAPTLVSEKLGLESDSDVTEIKRLRFLNHEPISVDVTYIVREVGERLCSTDLRTQDIFHILEEKLYISLGHADLQISAGQANKEYATYLSIEEGSPVLMIERTVHTANGKPIEFEYLYYRGDAFQFNFRINKVNC